MLSGERTKLYYTIGEVSQMTGLPTSVLRFWETEFSGLRPAKNRGGKRVYRQSEIDKIFLIKKLLYEDRFTIEGARKFLQEQEREVVNKPNLPVAEIRNELQEILSLLRT